jgi:hypothetical protein
MEINVYFHLYNSPPLIPVLNQTNQAHMTQCFLSSILILPSYVYVFVVVSFLMTFPLKAYVHSSPLHATFPFNLILLDLIIIWRREQVTKLLIMQYSLASNYFFLLQSKYSLQQPVLKHLQSMSLP